MAEVLVALTLLAVGIAATTGILILASRAMAHAEVAFRAALIASEVLGASAPGSGIRDSDAGAFRWFSRPGPGLEVRFEAADGVTPDRWWNLGPDAPEPEEPPWWSSWWP
jgi:Tfp pilus assembly protein PilV